MPSLRSFAVCAFVVATASFVVAQKVVPVENEPHHHLLFANDYVRVLDVIFPAGDASLFHTHTLDNLSVVIAAGTTRSDRIDAGGQPQPAPVGRIAFNSASPPYTHRVVNLGTTVVRIFDVQLLKGTAESARTDRDDLAGHVTAVENAHVRADRITLSPGETLAAHTHPRGWLEIDVAGVNTGHLEWHDAGTVAAASGSAQRSTEIVEIEPK
jgi:hypothetical protein